MRTTPPSPLVRDSHATTSKRRKGTRKTKLGSDARPANDTHPTNPPTPPPARARKVIRVELVSVAQGSQTVVGVRSLATSRVLFACISVDARGAELAMLAAERYCVERGYVLVMPSAERTRAA